MEILCTVKIVLKLPFRMSSNLLIKKYIAWKVNRDWRCREFNRWKLSKYKRRKWKSRNYKEKYWKRRSKERLGKLWKIDKNFGSFLKFRRLFVKNLGC